MPRSVISYSFLFSSSRQKRISPSASILESVPYMVPAVIHELAHATLHRSGPEGGSEKDKHTKEVEAESVAFAVAQAFGLDTSDYSFPYIASWTKDREMNELRRSMDLIRDTSREMIRSIEKVLTERELERRGIRYEIYQIREDSPSRDRMFVDHKFLTDRGWQVRPEDYLCVYSGRILPENAPEEIFRIFNTEHPEDYGGRSVSVSDVIVLYGEKTASYYVESVGFHALEGFVSEPEPPAPIPDVPALADQIDDLISRFDRQSYDDAVDDREEHLSYMRRDLQNGRVRDLREELEQIRDSDDPRGYPQRASQLLDRMDEMIREGTIPTPKTEEKITYYVCENMDLPTLGEYREVSSLQEAMQQYDALSSDRYPGAKGIGAVLVGEGTMRDVPLLSDGRIRSDLLLNDSFGHSERFRESIRTLKELMPKNEKGITVPTETKIREKEMSR